MKWGEGKIIANESTRERKYLHEALLIYQEAVKGNSINQKEDANIIDRTWKHFIHQKILNKNTQ